MVSSDYKKRATNIVELARKKGKIKTYADFCKTKEAKEYEVSQEEIVYYTSKSKGEK